jgi:hypothetical protein
MLHFVAFTGKQSDEPQKKCCVPLDFELEGNVLQWFDSAKSCQIIVISKADKQ